MPLKHFRKRKQLIYWVTAIVVIPAFVLVFGSTGYVLREQQRPNPEVARIGEESIPWEDFYGFQAPGGHGRLPAVLGGRGLRFHYPPNRVMAILAPDLQAGDPDQAELVYNRVCTVLALALLREAEKAGVDVSETEVNQFVHERPYFFGVQEGKPFEEAYKKYLKRVGLTSDEYLRGAREWLMIERYVQLTDQSLPASPSDAYVLYAREKTTCTYKKLVVRVTQAMREEAMDEIYGVTEENPEPDQKLVNVAVEKFLAKHRDDRRFWSKPKWRFEWVLAPFDALPVSLDRGDVEAFFQAHKDEYEDKTLEDGSVFEEVQKRAKREKQRAIAARTLGEELATEVRDAMKRDEKLALSDIQKRLGDRRGVETGVSHPEKLLATDELKLMEAEAIGASQELTGFLEDLDAMGDSEDRGERIARLQRHFDTRKEPFACERGLFRIRLLEYRPSESRSLKDEDGNIDAQLRVLVVDALQQEKAAAAARDLAETYADKIRKGEIEDFETLETGSKEYQELRPQLREAALGEPEIFPLYGDEEVTGYEILMLTDRSIPSRKSFADLPADDRQRYLRQATSLWQGNILPFHPYLRAAVIWPGPVLRQWMVQSVESGYIQLRFPKAESDEEEGA